jgi:hypothetical protein
MKRSAMRHRWLRIETETRPAHSLAKVRRRAQVGAFTASTPSLHARFGGGFGVDFDVILNSLAG